MESNFYNEVLIDHNLRPFHRHDLPCATCTTNGVNPTCGDDISLSLEIRDGFIVNGAYMGVGCAVSQASADIMLELVIGKSTEEAKHLAHLFDKMIRGGIADDELEEL